MERYNEYKDSGVQWLGEIPSHWVDCKLRRLSKIVRGGSPRPIEDYLSDEGYNWIKIGDTIKGSKYITSTKQKIKKSGLSATRFVHSGDLILTNSMSFGNPYILDIDGCIHDGWLAFSELNGIDKEYLYYVLVSDLCGKQFKLQVDGGVVQNLNIDKVKDTWLALPPIEEQSSMVAYLDTATAKIDEAIAQQQKMIDLLNERKQIIINNAVTKGLNPDAPMKDSGVDYIGLIPEHWVVRRMASLGVFSKGGGISRDNLLEEGEPAILYGDIYTKYNYFAEDIKNHVSKKVALASVEVHKNELLMTGSGETKEDIGKTIVFLGNKAYAGGDVIIFKQDNNNSSFLSYALNSSYAKNFRYKESKGEIVVHIYANAVRQLYLALPDITEQNSIVEYLNNKVGIIDSEICVVRKQISLLQERKQIIINDVVTGKVKVS